MTIYKLLLLKNCLLIFFSFSMSHAVLHLQTDVLNELEEEGKLNIFDQVSPHN